MISYSDNQSAITMATEIVVNKSSLQATIEKTFGLDSGVIGIQRYISQFWPVGTHWVADIPEEFGHNYRAFLKYVQNPYPGLFMVGGGVPKNFIQDTVVCAEVLGVDVPMHEYAIQITVADVRDGACSSSTLKEASSWGKVQTTFEQMVYAEATTVVPLIFSYVFHNAGWKKRKKYEWTKLFKK